MNQLDFRWLLIDSCGPVATLAIGGGSLILAAEVIAGRAFSAEWPGALRLMLAAAAWKADDLQVVGVVRGPGSFTGVRVGLAAAKGLCEAMGAKLIAVSRLEVLAYCGAADGLAVLDAGRDEVYVRDGGREFLMSLQEFLSASAGRYVVTADERVGEACADAVVVELEPTSALPILLKRWEQGRFDDVAAMDANYVRGERDIYPRNPVAGGAR